MKLKQLVIINFRAKGPPMTLRSILLSLLVLPSLLSAQSLEDNLAKYWKYRHKLVTQYMLVGDEQGYSLPASYINPGLERMKWSDNTIWLGWYMGTLATEYHLLHNERYQGYNDSLTDRVAENRTELHYALKAIIRLDANAEVAFPVPPCDSLPNLRNGFFMRDDVPINFTDSFPGYNNVDSDYSEVNSFNVNEMSQDQAYHVLLGLSLIRAMVPDTVVINGMNIRAEAQTQIELIANWIHDDGWLIKNPACNYKNVDRGHDASLLAKGVNLAIKFLTNNQLDFSSDVDQTADLVWNTLSSPSQLVTPDNLHMSMTLAAMGEGWGPGTLNNLMNLAEEDKWYAYPLLYIALRDTNSVANYPQHKPLMMFWADSMLNEAPIGGPLTTYPDSNDHGYGVNNRFIRSRVQHYVSTNPNEAGHQWNGLDYMLLHNLRLIVDPAVWSTDSIPNAVMALNTVDFSMYPNPAADILIINLPSNAPNSKMQVCTVLGATINEYELKAGRNQLDIAELQTGVYLVRVAQQVRRLTISH